MEHEEIFTSFFFYCVYVCVYVYVGATGMCQSLCESAGPSRLPWLRPGHLLSIYIDFLVNI